MFSVLAWQSVELEFDPCISLRTLLQKLAIGDKCFTTV